MDDTVVRIYDWRGSGDFVELSGPRQGDHGARLLEGVEGIWEAERSLVSIKTARLPGSIPVAVRIEELEIDFMTIIQGKDSLEWQWWNRRIHRLLSFDHDSLLVVQTLPWGPRWIKVRRSGKHETEIEEDPTWSLSQLWDWRLVAHDPDWRTKDLTASWSNNTAARRGNLRVANRGDRPTFVKWAGRGGNWNLQAPGGQWNPLPRMAADEEWKVDSHPLATQLSSTADRDKWRRLQRGFTTPISEPGAHAFGVECEGPLSAAKVQLRVEQRYEHPWG
ncbi:hypothetical protein [Gordonia malaquae]|uniref:hypothetical protein n=1 Tax=Gordonia malaquae TaxID=410332 RepID=UPI003017EE28